MMEPAASRPAPKHGKTKAEPKAAPKREPEAPAKRVPVKAPAAPKEPERDPHTLVVYFAARRNTDITATIPTRDAKLKLEPHGWRVAFLLDDASQFEAMKRARKVISMDVDGDGASVRTAIAAFGTLNAAQIAHEQRPSARRIIVRSDMDDTINATFEGNHPAKNLMWVLNNEMKRWGGVTVAFEKVSPEQNKARTKVLPKHDMPNYWSQQARVEKEAVKNQPQQPSLVVASPAAAPALGSDGLPILFHPAMTTTELRERILAIEEQLIGARAMLEAKERIEEARGMTM